MSLLTPSPDTAFYVTGGTLPPDAPSYVARDADDALFQSLLAGETCYVLNSRQMGKSSLCVRTLNRLNASGVRTAFCDLTKYGSRNLSAEQWYAALLAEIGRELNLRTEFLAYWKAHADVAPVQRLFGAIVEIGLLAEMSPLAIFIDEIDVTLSLPFSADEFFAAIRQCYVGRATQEELKRLSFCLLGTASPADLIQDTRVSPFNIGTRIVLRDFTEAEASPLAVGLANDKTLLSRVLHWTGGHPYLTQRLCRTAQEQEAKTTANIDQLCTDLFLTHAAKESDDNLAFVRNRLLKSEANLASLLDMYVRVREGQSVPDDDTNALCGILKLSGVLKQEDGFLKVRNRIYNQVFDKEWVIAHMPDAELRRQQAAYRQGMIKIALPGAWIVLLPLIANLLIGDHADRARMTFGFLAYGLLVGVIGFVTMGILFRPAAVSPRLLAGVTGCAVAGAIVLGGLFGEMRSIDDFSGDLSGWLRNFSLRVLALLVTWCTVSLPIYFSCIRKPRNLPPLTLAYIAGVGGVAVGYTLTMLVGIAFVRLGVMGASGADFAGKSWPMNSELNVSSLLVFMLSLFVALPVSMVLLNGIIGYTIGMASKNTRKPFMVLFRGILLYIILGLLFIGITSNLLRVIAIATTFLACLRYIARTGDGSL